MSYYVITVFSFFIAAHVKSNLFRLESHKKSMGASVRVVTDIDDTVKSSGGVKLLGIPIGGIDTHYTRGEFYPGAFQFAFEIASHRSPVPDKVSVLTARAKEFKFALALKPNDKLCSRYAATGLSNGIKDWGIGDVYYGSVAEWIFQNRKGERKFDNFQILLKNDDAKGEPRKYVFIGDTGEMDEEAGERIINKYPARMKAIFMHAVTSKKDRSDFKLPEDRQLNGVSIYYFRTYVGAAVKALRAGLISNGSLNRVIDQAKRDLSRKEPQVAGSRWRELEEDIQLAKSYDKPKPKFEELFSMFDLMSKA